MKRTTLLLLLLVSTICLKAQKNISGKVTCDGEAVVGAHVMETDIDKRIINQATTDANGFYTMPVANGKNMLTVHAEGYRNFEEKLNSRARINPTLLPKSEIKGVELLTKMHPVSNSYKLLYGHNGMKNVAQYIRVELLNDSLFTIVPPIMSSGLSESYPAENVMMFVDASDKSLMTGVSAKEAYTISGLPEDVDAHSFATRREYGADNYIPGDAIDDADLYTYPQFIFSVKRFHHLMEGTSQPLRVLIETADKSNFWVLYPTDNFSKELDKLLTKMQKKLKK